MPYKQFPYKTKFNASISSLTVHDGKTCEVLSIIAEPSDDYDMECLPLFRVRMEDGAEVVAGEEEINCEQTFSAVKQWCLEHLEEIALRESTSKDEWDIDRARKSVEAMTYDPHEYDYLHGKDYLLLSL